MAAALLSLDKIVAFDRHACCVIRLAGHFSHLTKSRKLRVRVWEAVADVKKKSKALLAQPEQAKLFEMNEIGRANIAVRKLRRLTKTPRLPASAQMQFQF